ncbi:nitroreductase family protein [Halobaculum sp. MBLA0147]|uniref:nitroreductase family protein n=1 Tax=Halobaculum sp. MBLA0147 TaxID=3079934 RepID=UPI00352311CA
MSFREVVRTRRSVHEYSDESLDRETIREIVDDARFSPSGYNLQPWEFLVLDDDEDQAALREVAYDQEHVTGAAATVVVFGNTDPAAHAESVFDDWLDKGYLPGEDVKAGLLENVEGMAELPEAERRVWTTRSTALAAMTLMHAAWDRGVASCPMEGFDADGVLDTFDVPDGYEPVMLITLGYPAEGTADLENDRKERRPVEEITHFGEFDPVGASDLPTGETDQAVDGTPADD